LHSAFPVDIFLCLYAESSNETVDMSEGKIH